MAARSREEGLDQKEGVTPRFSAATDDKPGSVYGDENQAPDAPSSPPGGKNLEYTGSPDNRAGDINNPRGNGTFDRSALKDTEGIGSSTTATAAQDRESSMLAQRGGSFYRKGAAAGGAAEAGGFAKLRARLKKASRKQVATLAITGAVGGGTIFGGAVLQGPFQFVHLAQKLQKFHLSANDDFSNRRLMAIYYYSKGDGQKSRLGLTSNKAADMWEKELLKETGMKPVYQDGNKRFIGFEIVDDNKAQRFLGSASEIDSRASARVEQSMGRGAEITDGDRIAATDNNGNRTSKDRKILNLQNVSFADRKAWIKTMGQTTGTNRLTSSLASRLLIKRAGVNFHPMNKVKGKFDEAAAKRVQKKREQNITGDSQGANGPQGEPTRDAEGNEVPDPASEAASEDTKKLLDNFKAGQVAKFVGGPAVVVGVLCMAKNMGDSVENYKYTNNVLPMMRMGMETITTGNQVMSGDDLDIASLGQLTQYMYDQEQKTSWTQAESIRAEEGKAGGEKMPPEADLGKAGEKPALFRTIDSIPLLGGVCGVIQGAGNALMGLPVIKQVSSFATTAATKGINGALGVVDKDLSIESLTNDALKAVAGKGVDPNAKGADYGNLANTGAFASGNDTAVAMGGKNLSNAERVNIAMLQKQYEKEENAQKSVIARYFDPLDSESAVSSVIDAAPVNPTQAVAMMSNPIRSIASSFSGTMSILMPKASAASYVYDYGMPKVGFSLEEQKSDLFEDPYANAKRMGGPAGSERSLEDDLPRLNEKYSKCFGMAVTAEEDGVHIETYDKSQMPEVYKNRGKDECSADKNTDDRFNQYRMYIADAVAAITASCHAGEESACVEIGIVSPESTGLDPGVAGEGAQKIVAVAEKEFEKNGNKALETCGENCGPEVQKYTGGPSGAAAPWCAWFVSWIYREAGYEFKGAPAGSDGNLPAVEGLITWFKQHGEHFTQSSGTKPQPGDVIMYGGGTHTGLVVKVEGDNIETIEGNTSGDGTFNANGETVGRKKFNYKTYTSRSIEFGRLKSF